MAGPPNDTGITWGKPSEREPIRVDQRGLIDKILTRYATKFPVLRELLQNADDAKAKRAYIHFETEDFVRSRVAGDSPDLTRDIHCWTIHNDGDIFSPIDWDRLKTIADGNPDQQKIGAFGVGFYSVFQITDAPCVKSGGNQMQFHWGTGDESKQLFVSRSKQTSPMTTESNTWTTFELPALKPSPLPGTPNEIGRFLAASLPFMSNLRHVTVAFDSHPLLRLNKTIGDADNQPLYQHLEPRINPGFMTVSAVNSRNVHIAAETLSYNGSSSSSSSSEKHMLVWSAEANVSLDPNSDLGSGLQKAMKKHVPPKCRFQLVYTGNDNHTGKHDPEDIFERLDSNLENVKAYVYVGHATLQTTGLPGHAAAPFIPTVERELIDFENKDVRVWNEALLGMGGFLARTIYEHELQIVANDESQHPRALQALKYFNFRPSEPAQCFSEKMKEAFFGCASSDIPILSTVGVLRASEIRDHDANAVLFLKNIPMLPADIAEVEKGTVQDLRAAGTIRPVDFQDVLRELRADGRVLNNQELTAAIRWILELFDKSKMDEDSWYNVMRPFKDSCRYYRGGQPASLAHILHFVGDEYNDECLPIAQRTLPYEITKDFPDRNWLPVLQWFPFTVIVWLDERIVERKEGILSEEEFLNVVLHVLARKWRSMDKDDHETVKRRLSVVPWLPTHLGYRMSKDVHLSDPDILSIQEVPVLNLGRPMDELLQEILLRTGVKPRLDLMVLLEFAEKDGGALDYFIKHYEHYRAEFEDNETRRIVKTMKIIPARNFAGTSRRIQCVEAFTEPTCRKMGFWTLEEEYLEHAAKLNVLEKPPVPKLMKMISSQPPVNKEAAVGYFEYLSSRCSSGHFNPSQLQELSSIAFVPISDTERVAPGHCYVGKPESDLHEQMLKFVDFGGYANRFLQDCGAQVQPAVEAIASALAQDPSKFLSLCGGIPQYLNQLRIVAQSWERDPKARNLGAIMLKLRELPVLVGLPFEAYGKNEGAKLSYGPTLLRPAEVVTIGDDDSKDYYRFRDVENLYHAPRDLEGFYRALGSKLLVEIITETAQPEGDEQTGSAQATETRELILERLKSLIPTFRDTGVTERNERYKWMTEGDHFKVRVFRKVKVVQALTFGNEELKREYEPTVSHRFVGGCFELLLASRKPNYDEMAYSVSKLFFETPGQNIRVVFSSALSKPLNGSDGSTAKRPTNHIEHPSQASSITVVDLDEKSRNSDSDSQRSGWLSRFHNRYLSEKKPSASWEDIDAELDTAIRASTDTKRDSARVKLRKEFSERCSGSKYKGHIIEVSTVAGYGFSIEKDVSKETAALKEPIVKLFLDQIVEPLRQVCGYPKGKIRVLHGPGCSNLTAFNRNGTVFLNLDHFERDHYDKEEEAISDLPNALLSWYFTLAHEFTHSVEPSHNANFELRCSRLCQRNAFAMFRLADPART